MTGEDQNLLEKNTMKRGRFSYVQVIVTIVVDHGFNLDLFVPRHRVWQLQVHEEMLPGFDIVRLRNTETCRHSGESDRS